jgi:type VI secretion system protein ImpL
MFNPQDYGGEQPPVELVGSRAGTRKVPQWVFLSGFFRDVLMADIVALGASGSSARTNVLRRWVLGSAAALFLLVSLGFLVSFAKNRALESTAWESAEGIKSSEGSGNTLPSVDALNQLERLRQSVETLARYTRQRPFGYRWGLFVGDEIYPSVRNLYFSKFRQLLLLPVQKSMMANLSSLPSSPSPANDYERTYDTLKGYLTTTSHPYKSTREFLGPLLGSLWAEKRQPDRDQVLLARKQFDFYSEELKRDNPFPGDPDSQVVKRGREYLAKFGGEEPVYRSMLMEANRLEKRVNFNIDVELSEQEVVNKKDVPGAFTKAGWLRMQNAIKNPNSYLNGETWVLGGAREGEGFDRAKLEQAVRQRYLTDFIRVWREFLNVSKVVPYKDTKDAAVKLIATSGSQSPLLALFHVASQNTGVDAPEIQTAFKPLYAVMPVSCADYVCPATNGDYMRELAGLQLALEEILSQPGPPNETSVAKAQQLASSAKLKTRQMALSFGLDTEGHLDQKMRQLLEDPITQVENVLRPPPVDAKGLCKEVKTLTGNYPFNPKITAPHATIGDLNSVFHPKDGALWKFYDANVQKLIVPQGAQYVQSPTAPMQVSKSFLSFFNRATAISKALYPEGATNPNLTFKIKPVKADGLDGVTLQIGAQTLEFSQPGEMKAVVFTWPGGTQEVKANARSLPAWFAETGLWAIYRFLTEANHPPQAPSSGYLEYDVRLDIGNNQRKIGSVAFDLDMGPNPPIFQKGYLSGLGCVAEVAK